MNTRRWLVCVLAFSLTTSFAVAATQKQTAKAAAKPLPGVELAQSVSLITGVAISPLLGVSAVGAWQYFSVPCEERGGLPWHAQPWFWVSGLLVVGLVLLKDAMGTAMPPGLKKPADVAEVIENKLSGLVAAGVLLPTIGALLSHLSPGAALPFNSTGLAVIDPSALWTVLAAPFTLAVYAVVWMAGHAINILILLSPWGVVDACLKSVRAAVLSAVTVVSLIDPVTGAILSAILILFAWLIAGWSFRLMVFGCVFSWDFLTLRRMRFTPDAAVNWAFTARKIKDAPIRTYGRLMRAGDGRLRLLYRPWLFLKERELELPLASPAVGRGLFHPWLVVCAQDSVTTMLTFPPRYRTHEEALGRIYGLPVTDAGLLRGLKAIGFWFRELFGLRQSGRAAA